jgi:hypothetical protein
MVRIGILIVMKSLKQRRLRGRMRKIRIRKHPRFQCFYKDRLVRFSLFSDSVSYVKAQLCKPTSKVIKKNVLGLWNYTNLIVKV